MKSVTVTVTVIVTAQRRAARTKGVAEVVIGGGGSGGGRHGGVCELAARGKSKLQAVELAVHVAVVVVCVSVGVGSGEVQPRFAVNVARGAAADGPQLLLLLLVRPQVALRRRLGDLQARQQLRLLEGGRGLREGTGVGVERAVAAAASASSRKQSALGLLLLLLLALRHRHGSRAAGAVTVGDGSSSNDGGASLSGCGGRAVRTGLQQRLRRATGCGRRGVAAVLEVCRPKLGLLQLLEQLSLLLVLVLQLMQLYRQQRRCRHRPLLGGVEQVGEGASAGRRQQAVQLLLVQLLPTAAAAPAAAGAQCRLGMRAVLAALPGQPRPLAREHRRQQVSIAHPNWRPHLLPRRLPIADAGAGAGAVAQQRLRRRRQRH